MDRQLIRQKWLENLRSGRFEQGRHVLRSPDNKFCCLGVLCETVHELYPERMKKAIFNPITGGDNGYKFDDTLPMTSLLNYPAYKALGLQGDNGYIRRELGDGGATSLTKMNDNGMSFDQIADFIENNPEKVFVDDDES